MESDQGDQKGKKKAKPKTASPKQTKFTFSKAWSLLEKIGGGGAGLAFLAGLIWWFTEHPAWAFWTALITFPIVVFSVCRLLKCKRAIGFMVVIGAVVASGSIAFCFPPKAESEFLIVCKRNFSAQGRNSRPHFWLVNKDYQIAYPIHIAMHVMVTNLKPRPVTVDYYQMENKTKTGWISVYSIDARTLECFWIEDITNALRIEIIGGVFSKEIETPLAPHTPIFGMIFMEMPKIGVGDKWRMRIREIDGSESVEAIQFSKDRGDEAPIHRLGFSAVEERDLSNMNQRFYHDQ